MTVANLVVTLGTTEWIPCGYNSLTNQSNYSVIYQTLILIYLLLHLRTTLFCYIPSAVNAMQEARRKSRKKVRLILVQVASLK